MKKLFLNRQIRVPQVQLVDAEGENRGIIRTEEAIQMAMEAGLDLALVNPTAVPPVAKIIDYGSYKYHQKKVESKMRQAQKQGEMKGIRLGIRIGEHDLEVKRKQAEKFLEKGHSLRIQLIFRGREITHFDLGEATMKKFLAGLEPLARIDQPPKRQGYQLIAILSPKK